MLKDVSVNSSENIYSGLIKGIVIGVICLTVAIWFWLSLVGNPFDELALIRKAETTHGTLVDSFDVESAGSNDRIAILDRGIYAFYVDGQEFKTFIDVPLGELNEREKIEYLPDNPEVNRVKGEGCQSVVEWLWRKMGIGGIFLLMFCSVGFFMLKGSIIEYKCKKIRLEVENINNNLTKNEINIIKQRITKLWNINELSSENKYELCRASAIIEKLKRKSEK